MRPNLKEIQRNLLSLKETRLKFGSEWAKNYQEGREFFEKWTVLKESLIELQKMVELQKAALNASKNIKSATPPSSPKSPFLTLPQSPKPTALPNRPTSQDPRRESVISPRFVIASPRHASSVMSPRVRGVTAASITRAEESVPSAGASTHVRSPPVNIPKLATSKVNITQGSLEVRNQPLQIVQSPVLTKQLPADHCGIFCRR